jgi:hypothetical protein
MIKFSDLAPAKSISAKQLDDNFREVAPSEDQDLRHIRLFRGQDGWKVEVFPEFPFEAALLSSNGDQPFWMSVSELLNELVNAGLMAEVKEQLNNGGTITGGSILPNTVPVSSLIPGASGSLLVTNAVNTVQWSDAPPSGTPAWRQVERCDGQKMYVWGTEWA